VHFQKAASQNWDFGLSSIARLNSSGKVPCIISGTEICAQHRDQAEIPFLKGHSKRWAHL
jgi:hypothetical protein